MDLEALLWRERHVKENVTEDATQDWHEALPVRMIAWRGEDRILIIAAYHSTDLNNVVKMFNVMVAGTSADAGALLLDTVATDRQDMPDSLITVVGDRDGNVDYVEQCYKVDGSEVTWGAEERVQWRNGLKGRDAPFMKDVRDAMMHTNSKEAALVANALDPEWMETAPMEVEAMMIVVTVASMIERGADAVGCFPDEHEDVMASVIEMASRWKNMDHVKIALT